MTTEQLQAIFRDHLTSATEKALHDRVISSAVRAWGRGGRAHRKLTLEWLAHVGAARVAPVSIMVERQMYGAGPYTTEAENPEWRAAYDILLAMLRAAATPAPAPKRARPPTCEQCGAEPGWAHASFCARGADRTAS